MNSKGLTLGELLLAVALLGLIGGMATAGQVALMRTTMQSETASTAQTEATYVAAHIYKNLYAANRINLVSATEIHAWRDEPAVNTPVDLTDDTEVTYRLVNSQILRDVDYNYAGAPADISGEVVAAQAESLEFTYDPTGNFSHLVTIELSAWDPQGDSRAPAEISAAVLPRGIAE